MWITLVKVLQMFAFHEAQKHLHTQLNFAIFSKKLDLLSIPFDFERYAMFFDIKKLSSLDKYRLFTSLAISLSFLSKELNLLSL
jgi:hypothetical protein